MRLDGTARLFVAVREAFADAPELDADELLARLNAAGPLPGVPFPLTRSTLAALLRPFGIADERGVYGVERFTVPAAVAA